MPYFLILLSILFRLLPHPPNFTPVLAISLFGAAYLPKKIALFLPLAVMIISDFFLGFHNLILFTWGSMFLGAVIGLSLRKKRAVLTIAGITLFSSFLFFLLTNFGVWLITGMYPHTLAGLIDCYYLALPFFKNSLMGDILYTAIFFGGYEIIKLKFKTQTCLPIGKISKITINN